MQTDPIKRIVFPPAKLMLKGYRKSPVAEECAMKNSKRCPKCQSRGVIRVPGEIGSYGAGNNIRLGWTIFHAVKVTRYLCGSCGFSEEWVDSADDIAKIGKKFGASPG